jgi:hypothetical protein
VHILILVVLLLAVIGPGLWVKSVMQRYRSPVDRYPRSGGQTARDLLDRSACATCSPDYRARRSPDPLAKAVRLGRQFTADRSPPSPLPRTKSATRFRMRGRSRRCDGARASCTG